MKIPRTQLAKVITAKILAEPNRQSDWIQVLAGYLVQTNRTNEVDLIVNDIAHELALQSGTLTVEVTSAQALSSSLRTSLEAMLVDETGASAVRFHETVDTDMLGGFIARTPDAEIDMSIDRTLRKIAAIS